MREPRSPREAAGSDRDRRRFFRIEDRLPLSLRRVEAGEERARPRTADAMVEIDRRLKVLIGAARVQAPAVAELAELLNRKLDHVVQTLELSEELAQRAAFREHAVNLSACGMALTAGDFHEAGTRLAIEMLIPPNATRLAVLARVVRCDARETGGYELKLDFSGIGAEDQEFLIQYIMRRQSQYLQQLREERETRPAAIARREPR